MALVNRRLLMVMPLLVAGLGGASAAAVRSQPAEAVPDRLVTDTAVPLATVTDTQTAARRPARDRRPSDDVMLRADAKAKPKQASVLVVAEDAKLERDVVAYESRGGAQCLTVVGNEDTLAMCEKDLGDAVMRSGVVMQAAGPLTGEAPDKASKGLAFIWGASAGDAVTIRVREPDKNGGVSFPTYSRPEYPSLSFFIAPYNLVGPHVIEGLAADGSVVATRDW